MKLKKLSTQKGIFALGAINGLLAGVIVEEARVIYLAQLMSQARREVEQHHPDWIADFIYPDRGILVPFVCIVAFAGTSYLVHRYFISRPQALLWLWLILGVAAIWAGYFMASSNLNAFSLMWVLTFAIVSYLGHRLWKHHAWSFPLLWLVIGVSAVIILAFGVQLIGLLFYWPEVRNPLLWLLCLAVVMIINSIYGAVLQRAFPQSYRGEL